VRETDVSISDLIAPCFIREGNNVTVPIASMPGIFQFSVDRAIEDLRESVVKGLQAILLFGIPDTKDPEGRAAENVLVPEAVHAIRTAFPDLVIMTDVCLCSYTDHGHCGPLDPKGKVDNAAAVDAYARVAIAHARAGADFVAPSGMMDGMVAGIRLALDREGFSQTGIMSYSAKYASHFYGPFRDATAISSDFGDRRTYQMDPANRREALREIECDIEEGADIVMVKPALAYLDIIREARDAFDHPIAAYNVSGEYSMVEAAIEKKWISPDVAREILTSIKRAGADMIITYSVKRF